MPPSAEKMRAIKAALPKLRCPLCTSTDITITAVQFETDEDLHTKGFYCVAFDCPLCPEILHAVVSIPSLLVKGNPEDIEFKEE